VSKHVTRSRRTPGKRFDRLIKDGTSRPRAASESLASDPSKIASHTVSNRKAASGRDTRKPLDDDVNPSRSAATDLVLRRGHVSSKDLRPPREELLLVG